MWRTDRTSISRTDIELNIGLRKKYTPGVGSEMNKNQSGNAKEVHDGN
jgi:hypothetical protein